MFYGHLKVTVIMPAPKKRKGEEGTADVSPVGTPSVKKRRKGIQYDPAEICQEVFEAVRNHKTDDGRLLCESFIRIPKRRSDPEYYELVENPIDLMKIQNKLKNEEYDDIDQMTDDFSLLVKNALQYYRENTQEHQDASELWDLYEERKTATLARVLGGSSSEEPAPEERAPVKMRISLAEGGKAETVAPSAVESTQDEDTDVEEDVEQSEGVDLDATKVNKFIHFSLIDLLLLLNFYSQSIILNRYKSICM